MLGTSMGTFAQDNGKMKIILRSTEDVNRRHMWLNERGRRWLSGRGWWRGWATVMMTLERSHNKCGGRMKSIKIHPNIKLLAIALEHQEIRATIFNEGLQATIVCLEREIALL
ncbi:unnamed protein product [Spirodela intermedia]|uniref:Uncharacterized protein n=1 Tax=Spirodela intermedia TaxID=51605 RepID=A0A7I8LEV6_SPIIN|nr:unnamed protein product [Spirodela intermedia]